MQIEYWARLGHCAEDNPDLPLEFIKECLLAKEEVKGCDLSEFEFRGKSDAFFWYLNPRLRWGACDECTRVFPKGYESHCSV